MGGRQPKVPTLAVRMLREMRAPICRGPRMQCRRADAADRAEVVVQPAALVLAALERLAPAALERVVASAPAPAALERVVASAPVPAAGVDAADLVVAAAD
jgi:hypothetical protein